MVRETVDVGRRCVHYHVSALRSRRLGRVTSRGMRAGRIRACRMKSMNCGRKMLVKLLPARSQYFRATAGIAPAVCSFSFPPTWPDPLIPPAIPVTHPRIESQVGLQNPFHGFFRCFVVIITDALIGNVVMLKVRWPIWNFSPRPHQWHPMAIYISNNTIMTICSFSITWSSILTVIVLPALKAMRISASGLSMIIRGAPYYSIAMR